MNCGRWRAHLGFVAVALAVGCACACARGEDERDKAYSVGLQIDVGWPGGYCHIIAADGTLLIQMEDGFSAVWHADIQTLSRDEFEQRLRIPCCQPASLVHVRQIRWLGIGIGRGSHWAHGGRFWWVAVPAERWRVDNLERARAVGGGK